MDNIEKSFFEGYNFFEKNIGTQLGANATNVYVNNVYTEILKLMKNLNDFKGFQTGINQLKGNIAEFWHSGTFNINAVARGSTNRTFVLQSNEFGSVDIGSNFGNDYGLKYYKTGVDSANQQAKSIFEKFKEYQAHGGKDDLNKFLSDRGFSDEDIKSAIYSGQYRIIPKEQLEGTIKFLEQKIAKESITRPELVEKYSETLKMLKIKIEDSEGTESIPLSTDNAKKIAGLSKEGLITEEELKKLGVSTEDIIKFEYILKESFKAGLTAVKISLILKLAPEIYKAIKYLIDNGEIDINQFKKIGIDCLQAGSEAFLRGSIAATITGACKAGLWGESLKTINPTIIGILTVFTLDIIKNSFKVAQGKMSRQELANEMTKEMFVLSFSLGIGFLSQTFINIPVFSFLIGNFIGSILGSFVYDNIYDIALSFCIDTGFTMFGLVEQDYKIPDYILKEIGIKTFDFKIFKPKSFKFKSFKFKTFDPKTFELKSFKMTILRRGVIGVSKIGYI
ncbi:hypothetical protein CA839_00260 [Fusobacterium polymorphum]|uniref:Uncharacterized protein n=1 Tax=Fusobacterium nucleatum subsp. polymorphum TaxID=76857 RepID=A0A246ED33_FUSNP|nr:hypothetical protein [Fusobacterium polymorphum]OWP24513.1 hypothetical protein CA839_00260 [Fusobacterium polymorphum]